MGVKNLWDILESCKKKLPLNHLQNKRICIDLSCWIVQLHQVHKSHSAPREKLYLKGLFHRLRALIALNCTLILVADGSIPAIKLATYRKRLKGPGTKGVISDEPGADKMSSLRRNMGSEFSCMIKEAKAIGMALGIPCLDGMEEAEAQCALLNVESLCDGCFTSDSDIFLFGARTVYRDICLGEGGYVICYEMADIERTLGFGRNSLIGVALLLGSDYSSGVRGIGQESACQIIKAVGDDVILKRIASEGLTFLKKTGSKKQGKSCKSLQNKNAVDDKLNADGSECNIQTDDLFSQIIAAYLKPKCHQADSDAVYRALSIYPFKLVELQKICESFFEWPPETTDEYILPKIAERDLRRLAQLRTTSSKPVVRIPLHEVPVKCFVSDIIKQRKIQGNEYFEVSLNNFHGLQTSVVPADVIKSACPEKIVEFEEKKAQRKKQHKKTKNNKSNNRCPTDELDQQLQNLLLDINTDAHSAENCAGVFSVEISTLDHSATSSTTLDKTVEQKSSSENGYENSTLFSAKSSVLNTDFIDLLSPSPPIRDRKISKGIQVITKPTGAFNRPVQQIDVIDLSDTEYDASPEHLRKARELRSFIATIRDGSS